MACIVVRLDVDGVLSGVITYTVYYIIAITYTVYCIIDRILFSLNKVS